MAKNTKKGFRKGALVDRSQTYNTKTKQFIKRDDDGKFMAAKDTPYKNVRKENNAKLAIKK